MSDSQREIENLLYTYAERIDLGDFEGVADLFEHAVITSPGAARGPGGRAAALAVYQQSTRLYPDGTPRTKHVTTNAIIEVDEANDRATSRAYFTVFQCLEDFPLQAIISGRYHDQFERVDGCWRFTERMMLPELLGDLSRHLLIKI
ncbi:MAG: 3-phenylpropionate/cinnamic acid dioxygenase small subunit [Myxococcota bacterium]|jgi:3-phenylpropionate/cinnamic acid dioxygenase small subunit